MARGIRRRDRPRQRARRRAIRKRAGRSGDDRMSADPMHELLRESLDHCVKCTICETVCPVSNVTPLFPGPKYAGPQAERYRIQGEAVAGRLGRLLLGLRALHPGTARRASRSPSSTPTRASSSRSATASSCATGSSPARPWSAGSGTPVAPLANLDAASSSRPRIAGREDARACTATRRCPSSRAAASARGRKRTRPGGGHQDRLLPRLRHRVLRARRRREGGRGARAQRLPRRGPQAGLLRAAAAVQRPVRRRPQVRAAAGRAGSRRRARRHDHRRQRDQLHADAQARGARDPRRSRTTPTWRSSADQTYDICELLLELHDRGELKTDFQPVHETVAYHAPCQQQGHWIGKPAVELLRADPRARRRASSTRAAAGSPVLTGSSARSTRSRWRSAPTCSARSRPPAPGLWRVTARPAAGRSSTPPAVRRSTRSSCCTGPTGLG